MCVQYYKLETILVVSDVITYCPSSTIVKIYAKFVFNFSREKQGLVSWKQDRE